MAKAKAITAFLVVFHFLSLKCRQMCSSSSKAFSKKIVPVASCDYGCRLVDC